MNFRTLPGETSADVIAHLKKVMEDDRVSITVLDGLKEPAAVSPGGCSGFESIHTTLRQVYPEASCCTHDDDRIL
ncbi:MAG: hypothetical protein MZV63_42960 [Marinilabiliales bacterium]|nr:hypothetical protein [Marinilabiliales bacterium]